MSTKNRAKLASIIAVLAETPGQHVWAIGDALGMRRGTGDRNVADDVIRRLLVAAESRGEVTSAKVDGRRLWFVAEPVSVEQNTKKTLPARKPAQRVPHMPTAIKKVA